MIKKILFIILIMTFVLNNGFTEEFLVKDSKIKICILYFQTNYKKEFVKNLIKILNENKMNVHADLIIYGNNYKSSSYNAVVILSDIQRNSRRDEVLKYINSNKKTNNIILIDTNQSTNAHPKIKDVDSITAASENSNINKISNIILLKIKKYI